MLAGADRGSRAEQIQIARLEALVGWTEALRDTTSAHVGLEKAIPATAETAAPVIRPALTRLAGQLRTRCRWRTRCWIWPNNSTTPPT